MTVKTIGIVGCGVIGGALVNWLKEHTPHNILISDPAKGFADNLSLCDIIFINIHIPTNDDGNQDLTTLEEIIQSLPDVPVYIRTTVLPGTSDYLSNKHQKKIYFMPEFLTERTAEKDFDNQQLIFTGNVELLKNIFLNKHYICMSNKEAELAKYAHNVFGALKVTYFNAIYDICQQNNLEYSNVLDGILLSGYINKPHTTVPGPDGLCGYGGKCFPKDIAAFKSYVKADQFKNLLKTVESLNQSFRYK